MAGTKTKSTGTFTFNKLGTKVHFGLWDARQKNLLLGQAGKHPHAPDISRGLLELRDAK